MALVPQRGGDGFVVLVAVQDGFRQTAIELLSLDATGAPVGRSTIAKVGDDARIMGAAVADRPDGTFLLGWAELDDSDDLVTRLLATSADGQETARVSLPTPGFPGLISIDVAEDDGFVLLGPGQDMYATGTADLELVESRIAPLPLAAAIARRGAPIEVERDGVLTPVNGASDAATTLAYDPAAQLFVASGFSDGVLTIDRFTPLGELVDQVEAPFSPDQEWTRHLATDLEAPNTYVFTGGTDARTLTYRPSDAPFRVPGPVEEIDVTFAHSTSAAATDIRIEDLDWDATVRVDVRAATTGGPGRPATRSIAAPPEPHPLDPRLAASSPEGFPWPLEDMVVHPSGEVSLMASTGRYRRVEPDLTPIDLDPSSEAETIVASWPDAPDGIEIEGMEAFGEAVAVVGSRIGATGRSQATLDARGRASSPTSLPDATGAASALLPDGRTVTAWRSDRPLAANGDPSEELRMAVHDADATEVYQQTIATSPTPGWVRPLGIVVGERGRIDILVDSSRTNIGHEVILVRADIGGPGYEATRFPARRWPSGRVHQRPDGSTIVALHDHPGGPSRVHVVDADGAPR